MIDFPALKKGPDLTLIGEVEFCMGPGDDILVAMPL
jgi:hypothetical protein